jgi:N-methylhydantoinase A
VGNTSYRLGCDIGGTFTDFVLVDDKTGEFQINKCLTTPADPSDAVEEGIRGLLERVPGFMPKIDEIIHGTTLVINAIIERKGAKTARCDMTPMTYLPNIRNRWCRDRSAKK